MQLNHWQLQSPVQLTWMTSLRFLQALQHDCTAKQLQHQSRLSIAMQAVLPAAAQLYPLMVAQFLS